jgi:NACHT domain- and WD repeat-containing protein
MQFLKNMCFNPGGVLKPITTGNLLKIKSGQFCERLLKSLTLMKNKAINISMSATHQEILRGALNPPKNAKNPEEHIFAFIRNTAGLPEGKHAKGYVDLVGDQPDLYCAEQLKNLKEKLKGKLKNNYIPYNAEWVKDHTEMNDPKWFADEIYKRLEDIIDQQIKVIVTADEIEHEVRFHEEFKIRLTEHFSGRGEILKKIVQYLGSASENKIMSLIGESGSGKSSVMAEAAKRYADLNEGSDTLVVYRFLGTTSPSSSVISLLQSVCGQIAAKFDTNIETLAGEGRKDSMHDVYTMSEVFRKCLELAKPEKPVVVFLDALDQLSDIDNARSLTWLPNDLPANSRLIVSALIEQEVALNRTNIEKLPVLPKEEAKVILVQWLSSVDRLLTPVQAQYVLDKFKKTGLPIYLKLAFENARDWHHYDKVHEMKDDVPGIINDYFDMLNTKHHPEFVKNSISYLLSGRYMGLTENEILEILVFDEDFWENIFLKKISHPDHTQELKDMKKALEKPETGPKVLMKIPIVLWSRLFLDLEPFLTERDADGVPIITFFHRQFNEVLRERYELMDEKPEN